MLFRSDLVHELGELGAAEEVAHDGAEGLRIDEFAGRDAFNVLLFPVMIFFLFIKSILSYQSRKFENFTNVIFTAF